MLRETASSGGGPHDITSSCIIDLFLAFPVQAPLLPLPSLQGHSIFCSLGQCSTFALLSYVLRNTQPVTGSPDVRAHPHTFPPASGGSSASSPPYLSPISCRSLSWLPGQASLVTRCSHWFHYLWALTNINMLKRKLYNFSSGPVCVCPFSLLMLPLRVYIKQNH